MNKVYLVSSGWAMDSDGVVHGIYSPEAMAEKAVAMLGKKLIAALVQVLELDELPK